jgi:hypothetical protein
MVFGVSYRVVGRADCPYFARAERLAQVRNREDTAPQSGEGTRVGPLLCTQRNTRAHCEWDCFCYGSAPPFCIAPLRC